MRKIVIHKAGDYRQLSLEECPDLTHEVQDIIVSVKASGINYADIIIRWGLYESAKQFVGWPITPGFEFSGIVKSVAPGVTEFVAGDEVFGVSLFNAYASEVRVLPHQIFRKPASLSFEEAAGVPAVFMTAYHALLQNVVVRPGMTALIHSAAGGVGSSLVQLCRLKQIKSIGVVGSAHKIDFLQKLGCDFVIDKSKEDLWGKVGEVAPLGVDLIFDANGGHSLKASYDHLAPSGKLIAYGAHTMFPKRGGKVNWPKLLLEFFRTPRFNPLSMTSENKSLITFNLSFLFERRDLLGEAMTDIICWLNAGAIRPAPTKTFPFHEVAEAHRELESGMSVGKLVLSFD